MRDEAAIWMLAQEIARQNDPTSILRTAQSPHAIARALFLLGWRPPHEVAPSRLTRLLDEIANEQ